MDTLVVDGYNIIGAWDELVQLKLKDIGLARDRLIELMSEYHAYSGQRVIVVFDAHYVQGIGSKQQTYKVDIIYTKKNETADECIEKLVSTLKNIRNQVYVATSDYTEQRIIFAKGALRISARELLIELENMNKDITKEIITRNKRKPQSKIPLQADVLELFEKWRRGDN